MKEILIFAGTTEGRKLSEYLLSIKAAHTICVATEYGEMVLKKDPLIKIHCKRMNQEEMKEYINSGEFVAVVDATHPYAKEVTKNIQAAAAEENIPYLRLKREIEEKSSYKKIVYFENSRECAKTLETVEGNILLTTGRKELEVYCTSKDIKSRLYVRVLPELESLKCCMDQGITGKQILALQGPFTVEMNEAIFRQYKIMCLVTKESGKTGGYQEKIKAAERVDIPVFVIRCFQEDEGYSFEEVCQELKRICGQKQQNQLEIILAGVGMGSHNNLTKEVDKAIKYADILIGAKRILAEYQPRLEKKFYYRADQIIPYLKEIQKKNSFAEKLKIVVLFSGDSGFYSGCQSLYQELQSEIDAGRLNGSVCIMPGISSVSYFAACINESYQDALIDSMHGKEILNLVKKIKTEKKVFLLTSGVKDINRLGKILVDAKLDQCLVWAGFQLSYPNQKIMVLTPKECCDLKEEGLYICCIKNPLAEPKKLTCTKTDMEFIRGNIPMTKEEVREIVICKLRLYTEAVVYDIGSGTGSIAVEIAELSDTIQVFAIEKKEEAVLLIKKNQEKFQLENLEIVFAKAPEGFLGLPVPTHAFIGGSGGEMKEILSALYRLNPRMRVVINAVSIETICEIKEVLQQYPIEREEVVQVQISRARNAGVYHLMQAENPVWICAFYFREG